MVSEEQVVLMASTSWTIDTNDVVHGLLEIGSASKNHEVLGEGGGGCQRRLTVVAGQHACEGTMSSPCEPWVMGMQLWMPL